MHITAMGKYTILQLELKVSRLSSKLAYIPSINRGSYARKDKAAVIKTSGSAKALIVRCSCNK